MRRISNALPPPPGTIAPWRSARCPNPTPRCRTFTNLLGIGDEEPDDGIAEPRLRTFVTNVRIGQINPDWFTELNPGRSIYDLVLAQGRARTFLDALLGGTWYPGAGHTRRVFTDRADVGSFTQKPIDMHCDGPSLSRHTYSLNVWVPLIDCGVDAPSLQFVPGPFEPLQRAVRHDMATATCDYQSQLEQQKFYSSGRDGRPRFMPTFRRGDVSIFHNWIMHGSYWTSDTRKMRTSFELRFNAPDPHDFEKFGKNTACHRR
jgi:hypothetical protein